MTILKINAITVPADSGDELVRRFAQRAGAVDNQDGFEGFELLKPLDADRPVWLVVTRWRDEAAFQAWASSRDFRAAHGGRGGDASGGQRPVGLSAELWSYEAVELATRLSGGDRSGRARGVHDHRDPE